MDYAPTHLGNLICEGSESRFIDCMQYYWYFQ